MRLNVYIADENKSFSLSVEQYLTVLQMKIYIEFIHDIPFKIQTLIYEGSTVLKDKYTLGFYDIRDGDNVSLVIETTSTMSLVVKTLTGKRIEVAVKPSWSIEELKLQILSREGIPIDQQRVIWRGKLMENHRTIKDYGCKNLDVIHLILRLRGS